MTRVFFSLLILLSSKLALSSHLAGGHLEYECIGPNQYRVFLIFFRDCDGLDVGIGDGPFLRLESASCDYVCTDLGQMDHVNHQNIDYGCGNSCLFGSEPGFQKWVFDKVITLPFECPDWKVSINISARNITDFAGSGVYHNYAIINNQGGICNNSPKFTDMSVWLGCQNTITQFNNSYTESDGDQLVFEFTNPQTVSPINPCDPANIEFDAGLDSLKPFHATAPFVINNSTGIATFTPVLQGTSYFAIKIKEFRSGIQIGEYIRDGEIIILSCSPSGDVSSGVWEESNSQSLVIDALTIGCHNISINADVNILDISTYGYESNNFNVSLGGVGTQNATVQICPVWDNFTDLCEPVKIDFQVNVTTALVE